MKRIITFFILLILISPTFSQVLKLKNDGKYEISKIDIPFEIKGNLIVLKVQFNNTLPLKFIFDTGAEHTILTEKRISDLLRIPYAKKFEIIGSDLKTKLSAYIARGIHLRIGENVHIDNHAILVLEEDYFRFSEFIGEEIHGILGADVFKNYVIKLDYQKQILTLYSHNYFKSAGRGYKEIPIKVSKNKPYIETNAVIDNRKDPIKLKLLLDTGAGLTLLLVPETHPLLSMPANVINGNIGMGLGGSLEGYLGRVNKLEIGEFTLYNTITNFHDLIEGTDTTYMDARNGIFGGILLSKFHVILDLRNEKLYLKPNKFFKKKIKVDKSGITIVASGINFSTFTVHDLLENSPGKECGLQTGDEIISINHIPAKILSIGSITNIFKKKKGKMIRLVVKRNGKKYIKKFMLRTLI